MNDKTKKMPPPGFLRRMGAILYDGILLCSVFFLTTALLLPLNDGKAFNSGQWFYPLYLLWVSFMFFSWFWTHGGQTLGMRAWKIRLCTLDHQALGWRHALVRFVGAMFSWGAGGLGFLWVLFNEKKLSWHDLISKTQIHWDERES